MGAVFVCLRPALPSLRIAPGNNLNAEIKPPEIDPKTG
jgi:hypothetical protein